MAEPRPDRSDAVAPAPRRVADGLLSATLGRRYWLLWRLADEPSEAALRSRLAELDRIYVPLASVAGVPLPRASEAVTVCRARDLDGLPPELEATRLLCVGPGPRQRGVVHVGSLAHLLGLLSDPEDLSGPREHLSTSTYHEV